MVEKEFGKDWLMGFESVNKWFDSMKRSRDGREISKSQRTTNLSRIRLLVKFFRVGGDSKATPDSIIEWAKSFEEGVEVIDMLSLHGQWLQGLEVDGYEIRTKINRHGKITYPKLAKNSADQVTHSVLRGFFVRNGVRLPSSGKITNGRSLTKKNDSKFAIFRLDSEINMIVADYSQLRYFLGFVKNRDKIIAQCILSTSQDPIDILGLNVGFVRSQPERARLLWEGERTKTGEEFRVFFSKLVTADLRRYVANERSEASDDNALFVRKTIDRKTKEEKMIRVKPINLSENFKTASLKAGFGSGKGQNPFRPKRMRSIFSSACYQAKIDDNLRHIFMGHKGTISESYRELPVANLEMFYSEVEPYLSVYSDDSSKTQKELSKTQHELGEVKDTQTSTLKTINDFNMRLAKAEESNIDLREMVTGLNTQISEMMGEMRKEMEETVARAWEEIRDSYPGLTHEPEGE